MINEATATLPGVPGGLSQLVQTLFRASSLVEVVAAVRTHLRPILGADGVSFVLRDGDCCYYADEDAISPLWKGQRFPLSSCISGIAMETSQTILIEDIYEDARVPHDAYRPTFVKSLAMAPVRRHAPLAALGAYWACSRKATALEVEVLEAVAAMSAMAMANVAMASELDEARARREGTASLDQSIGQLRLDLQAFRTQLDDQSRLAEDNVKLRQQLSDVNEVSAQAGRNEMKALRGQLAAKKKLAAAEVAGAEAVEDARRADLARADSDAQLDVARGNLSAARDSHREQMTFLASASHDLRQPLQAMSLFVQALSARHKDDADTPLLSNVRRTLDSVTMLLDSLLDVAKLEAGGSEPDFHEFPVCAVVDPLLLEFEPVAEAKRVRLATDNSALIVRSDPVLLSRVLRNLVSNAVKFTPAGGEVSVTAGHSGGEIALEISDTGVGIPPDQLAKVFQPFQRLRNPAADAEGSGLGLAIVSKLLDALGHKLEVTSEPDRGSMFRVLVPVAHPQLSPNSRSL